MKNIEKQTIENIDETAGRCLDQMEEQLFRLAERAVDDYLVDRGLKSMEAVAEKVDLNQVEILPEDSTRLKGNAGSFNIFDGKIRMMEINSRLHFIKHSIHELLHSKASLIFEVDGVTVGQTYGLAMHELAADCYYLVQTSEALTEKMAIDIYEGLLKSKHEELVGLCGEEILEQAELRKIYPRLFGRETVVVQIDNINSDGYDFVETHYTYGEQRRYLDELVTRVAQTKGVESSQVYDLMMQAAFNPKEKISVLESWLDGTFGEGFYRNLGAIDGSVEDFAPVREYLDRCLENNNNKVVNDGRV